MQRNKSNEIARDIIRTAKETFNERLTIKSQALK